MLKLVVVVVGLLGALGARAQLHEHARDAEWLALLHYANGRSYVDDARYFLHPDGARDPLAELQASIEKLASDATLRCRFVARYQWLRERGLLPADADALDACDEYRQWRARVDAGSVVLVFAASYLNSPSSMYGHTFLRFDPAGQRGDAPLLSFALNFGANVPPRDNSLLFAYRGLAGGYPGLFTMQPYYEKVQEYSRLENRDLWEYRLNLDDRELDRLLAHVWELRDINFDYYFIDENCSFRLLELLEVARPGIDLTSRFALHTIPVDTIRAVREAGMVEGMVYRPSRQQELQHLLDQLDPGNRALAHELADDHAVLDTEAFRAHSTHQQKLMLLAAYRYLRYRHNREQRDAAVAERSLHLLRQLQRLSATVEDVPETPLRSDDGHRTGLVAIGGGRDHGRDVALLELRLAYHDLLDWQPGYPGGASLNMGRAQLRLREGGDVLLQRLDLVEITSVAPRGLYFDPLSWRVNFGWERQRVDDEEPLATQVNGGAGGSWPLLGGTGYLMGSARMEYNEAFDDALQPALGANAGLLWQRDWGAVHLDIVHWNFVNGVERDVATFGLQKQFSADSALRLSWSYRKHDGVDAHAVELSWRHYF